MCSVHDNSAAPVTAASTDASLSPRASTPNPHGLLLVDKPAGITSHDVVGRVRRALGTRKVGHAGTLDPAATGLLLIGVGDATRLLTYLVGEDKQYEATVRLGIATTTEDADGDITAVSDTDRITQITSARVEGAMEELTGELLQVPSAVSAIKVDGERAYNRVRRGEEVQLQARPVTVSELTLLRLVHTRTESGAAPLATGTARATSDTSETDTADTSDASDAPNPTDGTPAPCIEVADADIRVRCSAGTYVRALGRDLGAALGVGAHLTRLRRAKVGAFDVRDAVTIAAQRPDRGSSAAADEAAQLAAALIPVAHFLRARFPTLDADADTARALRNGQRIPIPAAVVPAGGETASAGPAPEGIPIATIDPAGAPIGLVEVRSGTARTLMNFPQQIGARP